MTDYLTTAEILAMHEDQIMRYGGSGGLYERGEFDSDHLLPWLRINCRERSG